MLEDFRASFLNTKAHTRYIIYANPTYLLPVLGDMISKSLKGPVSSILFPIVPSMIYYNLPTCR